MAVLPPILGRRDRGGVEWCGAPCGCPWEPPRFVVLPAIVGRRDRGGVGVGRGPLWVSVGASSRCVGEPYMAIPLHTIDKQRSIR